MNNENNVSTVKREALLFGVFVGMRTFVTLVTLCCVMFFIYGCAQKPEAEIAQAEKAFKEAEKAEAGEWAAASFKAAQDKLKEGKNFVSTKKYKEAKPAFLEATKLAQAATKEARAAKAEAEEAERRAQEEADKIKTEHTVARGDYLWAIANSDEVYGDGNKWYSIYKANKDEIDRNYKRYLDSIGPMEKLFKHPAQLIYAGQVFTIPRDGMALKSEPKAIDGLRIAMVSE